MKPMTQSEIEARSAKIIAFCRGDKPPAPAATVAPVAGKPALGVGPVWAGNLATGIAAKAAAVAPARSPVDLQETRLAEIKATARAIGRARKH